VTLNLAFCFTLFLGLAVITQGQAEDYYIYPAMSTMSSIFSRPSSNQIVRT
jgi:hypothetical protein